MQQGNSECSVPIALLNRVRTGIHAVADCSAQSIDKAEIAAPERFRLSSSRATEIVVLIAWHSWLVTAGSSARQRTVGM